MNAPIIIAWSVVVIMGAFSILLLMGKGSFLIAGYNTASREEKSGYNEKRLCRVTGGGLGAITIITAITITCGPELDTPLLRFLMPWGILMVILVMLILCNTWCRKK